MTSCTCLSDDSPLCRHCTARQNAQEARDEEVVPGWYADARAADEWAAKG